MVEKELPSESVGVVVKIDGKVQVYMVVIPDRFYSDPDPTCEKKPDPVNTLLLPNKIHLLFIS